MLGAVCVLVRRVCAGCRREGAVCVCAGEESHGGVQGGGCVVCVGVCVSVCVCVCVCCEEGLGGVWGGGCVG